MFHPSDWDFMGKPARKPTNAPEIKTPRWFARFLELESGESLTLYEPKAARMVIGMARAQGKLGAVQKFKGGGWRITRK